MSVKWIELKIPPVLQVLLAMFFMWSLKDTGLSFHLEPTMKYFIVGLLFIIAVTIALSAVLSFKISKTTVNPVSPESASMLVTSGIFQYTRNPMYLGMAVFLLGWAIFVNSVTALLIVPAFILFMTRFQIKPEERALTKLFETEFTAYCSGVRRWL